ncbi:MAG: 4-hydroxy-2-oxovalerate aldolase, partial [Synergistaceae bacterium]|nr:4-hydroxy-2-oxovalerate aldolase [Synergistaceae bacterium]
MKNKLKEKLERGEKSIGTFFECGSTAVIESMGLTGLDYAVIDAEHGPFEAENIGEYVCAAERRGLTPLARVKEISRAAIMKLLDVGAKGLIIPQVKTVDDVKEIVKFGK